MRYLISIPRYLFVLFASAFLLAGCGGRKAAESLETDANGYQCDTCNAKFYTDRDVFAAKCPACEKGTPFPVVGYQCDKDKHITIVRQGRSAVCDQCKSPVSAIMLPRAADLQTWGATKKSKQEVGG